MGRTRRCAGRSLPFVGGEALLDPGFAGAFVERALADRGQRGGHRHGRQRGAPGERPVSDGDETFLEREVHQAALGERPVTSDDGCVTVWFPISLPNSAAVLICVIVF